MPVRFALLLLIMLTQPLLAQAGVDIVPAAEIQIPSKSVAPRPMVLDEKQLAATMAAIRYAEYGFISLKKAKPVFDAKQIGLLASQIQKTLASLPVGAAAGFELDGLKGLVFFSGGKLYWHFDLIHHKPAKRVTFENEAAAEQDDAAVGYDENVNEEYLWALRPQQGQALVRGKSDWITTPIASKPIAGQRPRSAPPQATQANAGDDILKRIHELRGLFDSGLITRQEYRRKLIELITRQEKKSPSLKAYLQFLQILHNKGLIGEELYKASKKRALEKL